MEEPKYKIDDEVWFMFINEPFKSKVRTYVGGEEKLYRCSFFLTTCVKREENLFKSKEELIKHYELCSTKTQ